jgi:hypothetical protein
MRAPNVDWHHGGMTATDVSNPVERTSGLTRREQVAFGVFSTWIVSGLFLDGWSHGVHKPETFFTPWHALLYSGFGASVAWSVWDARRMRSRGEPEGDGVDQLASVGVLMFGIGMVGDFIWHTLFGIEVNVEALLSPTHLTLMTGGLLLAAMPVRLALRSASAGADKPIATLAVLQSVAACTAVAAFFTQFASAFRGPQVAVDVMLRGMGHAAEGNAVVGVMAVLVTNALLVGAATFLVARFRTRRFALTGVIGVVTLAVSGLTSFHHVALVLAALAGGLAGDIAVSRGRVDLVPIAVPLAMWPAWTAILALTTTFGWSPNVWAGAVFLSVLTGVGLRLLAGLSRQESGAAREGELGTHRHDAHV